MEESTTTTAQPNEQFIVPNEEEEPVQFTNNSISSDDFIEESTITFQSTESITVNLPQYTEINKMLDTSYINVSPKAFTTAIDQEYEEMVTWRKNIFLVPTGKAGKTFIKLISEWLNNFNIANSFQGIAIKVVMILPNLPLQKPSSTRKSKEHSKVLEDRPNMWNNGDLNGLLRDCRATQRKMRSGKKRTGADVTRIFSKLVFHCINEQEIFKAANQVKGSGGPSLP